MANLAALKSEIDHYLQEQEFAIFRGFPRTLDSLPLVYWDCDRYPDYKAFVATAKAAGVRMMVYHDQEFTSEQIDNAIERLEECPIPLEDRRVIERRLKEMRVFDGFTCSIELSFDHQGRIYVFDLHTKWYDEFSDLLDDIHMLTADSESEDEDDDESPMGGYFSKN